MRPRHPAWPLPARPAVLALVLILGALAPGTARAQGAPPPTSTQPPPPTPVPGTTSSPTAGSTPAPAEVSGTVTALDLQRHRLTVEAAAGRVEIGWDRNTLIYQPGGATTSAALQPGAAVKAGLDPSGTAYWIQVRQAPPASAAPPPAAPAPAPARP